MPSKLMTQKISLFALVMLVTGAIDSIRNLPATALFGTTLIFFAIFSAIVFLIPAALVSAELSATWTERGGIYHWARLAFGEKTGFLAIWLQWINTMVWYPTILSFIAATAAYLIDPALAQNKFYLVSVILIVFWVMTFINLKGVHVSAKFAGVCAVVGMLIPMALIILCAAIWVVMGNPIQLQFTTQNLLPSLSHGSNWISLTAIMTAFLGMELATVHVKDVHNPQKVFPKAMLYSVILILVTMVAGAMAIAIVMPHKEIGLVSGVMQAFESFFNAYHIHWVMPILAVMLLVGSLGQMVNWIISPAKGLMQAAENGFLPKIFAKQNKHKAASTMLITQAVLVSVICLAFLLMPSVNGSYWLLTDLSTQVYMLMYVLMFTGAIILRHRNPNKERAFKVPGGKYSMWVTGLLGLFGCAVTLIVGFFPPDGVDVGGTLHYEIVFSGGLVAMILPVIAFYAYYYTKALSAPPLAPAVLSDT